MLIGDLAANYPPLPQSRTRELILQSQAGNRQAQDLLIRHNLRYVLQVCYQMVSREETTDYFQDCLSAAIEGLYLAILKFDLSRETLFTTYAVHWIKQGIRSYRDSLAHIIPLPSHRRLELRNVMRKYQRTIHDATNRHYDLSLKNLLNTSVHTSRDYVRCIYTSKVSSNVIEDVPAPDNVADEYESKVLRKMLFEALSTFREKEREFWIDYFINDCTLEEIGERHGLTRERARQIIKRMNEKLPARLKTLGMSETKFCLEKEDFTPSPTILAPVTAPDIYEDDDMRLFFKDFESPEWFHDCPVCHERIISVSPDYFECRNCDFDSSGLYTCHFCGNKIPSGSSCLCAIDAALRRIGLGQRAFEYVERTGPQKIAVIYAAISEGELEVDKESLLREIKKHPEIIELPDGLFVARNTLTANERRHISLEESLSKIETAWAVEQQALEIRLRVAGDSVAEIRKRQTKNDVKLELQIARQALEDIRQEFTDKENLYLDKKAALFEQYQEIEKNSSI